MDIEAKYYNLTAQDPNMSIDLYLFKHKQKRIWLVRKRGCCITDLNLNRQLKFNSGCNSRAGVVGMACCFSIYLRFKL